MPSTGADGLKERMPEMLLKSQTPYAEIIASGRIPYRRHHGNINLNSQAPRPRVTCAIIFQLPERVRLRRLLGLLLQIGVQPTGPQTLKCRTEQDYYLRGVHCRCNDSRHGQKRSDRRILHHRPLNEEQEHRSTEVHYETAAGKHRAESVSLWGIKEAPLVA